MTLKSAHGALTEDAYLATPNLQGVVSFIVDYVHEKHARTGVGGWLHLYTSYWYEGHNAARSVRWREERRTAMIEATNADDEESFEKQADCVIRFLVRNWDPPKETWKKLFGYCRRFRSDQTTLPTAKLFRHSVGRCKVIALPFHENFILYDSRTAYALDQLVNAHYMENRVDRSDHPLRVEQMEFPIPPNRSRSRRVTFVHGESPPFHGNLGRQGWLGWIFASYVSREICRRLNANPATYGRPQHVWPGHEKEWYCYHLDMALWTLGGPAHEKICSSS